MKQIPQTRKTEIRYRTCDPKRMLNKYVARRVIRSWNETVEDSSTGETVNITRSELLIERGTLITPDLLASIKFWQEEGTLEGVEIEVSNQRRLAFVDSNTAFYPYKVSVKIDDKKHVFLLYATSCSCAIDIVRDYVELNYTGGFTVCDVREMDYCIILVDSLEKAGKLQLELSEASYVPSDTGYVGAISGDGDVEEADSSTDKSENDSELKPRFYQLQVRIVATPEESDNPTGTPEPEDEQTGSFIVQTYTAARANLIIEKWLNDQEQRRYLESLEHPDRTYVRRHVKSFLEESKIIPIGRFIPVDFSMAYKDEDLGSDS